ncbi:MAG: redoxin domain-containing protein [Rubrobacter sp.]|nr:redoxin domain-containing protein [Rubrobacter sp.]
MRLEAPRPVLLVLTLLLITGAIAALEFKLGVPGARDTRADATVVPREPTGDSAKDTLQPTYRQVAKEAIASKEASFSHAKEIMDPTGFINTDGVSIKSLIGKKVVLLDFWAYSCSNCKNVEPYLNAWYDRYREDGLQVIGVHTPEFAFEKDRGNVEDAVKQANIKYPVVLDNNKATWDAYNQLYWPALYLIDADGFIRYAHFGEGAYDETEQEIQMLLSERDQELAST